MAHFGPITSHVLTLTCQYASNIPCNIEIKALIDNIDYLTIGTTIGYGACLGPFFPCAHFYLCIDACSFYVTLVITKLK